MREPGSKHEGKGRQIPPHGLLKHEPALAGQAVQVGDHHAQDVAHGPHDVVLVIVKYETQPLQGGAGRRRVQACHGGPEFGRVAQLGGRQRDVRPHRRRRSHRTRQGLARQGGAEAVGLREQGQDVGKQVVREVVEVVQAGMAWGGGGGKISARILESGVAGVRKARRRTHKRRTIHPSPTVPSIC